MDGWRAGYRAVCNAIRDQLHVAGTDPTTDSPDHLVQAIKAWHLTGRIPREDIDTLNIEQLAQLDIELTWAKRAVHDRIGALGLRQLWMTALPSERDMIHAIKAIRQITGIGLRESKAIVDAVKRGEPQLISVSATVGTPGFDQLAEVATIEWRTRA